MDVYQPDQFMLCRTKLVEYLHMDKRLPHICIVCIPEPLKIMKRELEKIYKILIQQLKITHYIELVRNEKQIEQRVRDLIDQSRQINKKQFLCNIVIIGASLMIPTFVKVCKKQLKKQNTGRAFIFVLHHQQFGEKMQTQEYVKNKIYLNSDNELQNSSFTRFRNNAEGPNIQLTIFWEAGQTQSLYSQLEYCFQKIHQQQIVLLTQITNPLIKMAVISEKNETIEKRQRNLKKFLKQSQNQTKVESDIGFAFSFLEALIAFGVPDQLVQEFQMGIQQNKTAEIRQFALQRIQYCIDCILSRGDSAKIFNYILFVLRSLRNNEQKNQNNELASFEVKLSKRQIKQFGQLQIGRRVKLQTFLFSGKHSSESKIEQQSTIEIEDEFKIKFELVRASKSISKLRYQRQIGQKQVAYAIWPLSVFQIVAVDQNFIVAKQCEQSIVEEIEPETKEQIYDGSKMVESFITQKESFLSKYKKLKKWYLNSKKKYASKFDKNLQQLGDYYLKSQNFELAYLTYRLLYKLQLQVSCYEYLNQLGNERKQNFGDNNFLKLSKILIKLFNCCHQLKKYAEGLNYVLDLLFYCPSFCNLGDMVNEAKQQIANNGAFSEQTHCFLQLFMCQINGFISIRNFECANKYLAIIQRIFQDFWIYDPNGNNQYDATIHSFYTTLLVAQGQSLYLSFKMKKTEGKNETKQQANKLISRFDTHIKISQYMTPLCLDLYLIQAKLREILGFNSIDPIVYCMSYSYLKGNPAKFQFSCMLEILKYLKRNKNQQPAQKYFEQIVQKLITRVNSFQDKVGSQLDGTWLCRLKDRVLKENLFNRF